MTLERFAEKIKKRIPDAKIIQDGNDYIAYLGDGVTARGVRCHDKITVHRPAKTSPGVSSIYGGEFFAFWPDEEVAEAEV
ncbi:MAG TPA: hypothetical protein VFF56_02060 [Bacillota bacterium]|nr:hypothetical protein [Bacillota bacterium]